jgi:hypothetical protein
MPPRQARCPDDDSGAIVAILIILILVVIIIWRYGCHRRALGAAPAPAAKTTFTPGPMYYSDDADALITGRLSRYVDEIRGLYSQRTALLEGGPAAGGARPRGCEIGGCAAGGCAGGALAEYSGGGELGVDAGPYGLAEYGGQQIGYNDGIPEDWLMPSTPLRWYRPAGDHYGPEGPTLQSEPPLSTSEPDHDPLTN